MGFRFTQAGVLTMTTLLRFRDLKERGIVNSWPQLRRMIDLHEFPAGRLLSPNIRAWTGAEIDDWIASRPSRPVAGSSPLRGAAKARHEAKATKAAPATQAIAE
jgi:predicted DNA-binding transcriptional regulator AlpA